MEIRNKEFEVMGADVNPFPNSNKSNVLMLDATDRDNVFKQLQKYKPDVVINAINIPSVDFCEDNIQEARKIIVDTTKNMLDACGKNIKLVFLSSDYIFDGKNGPYSENDIPNATNNYGSLKLEGEKLVLNSNPQNLVVRTTILYGWHTSRKPNYALWTIDQLRKGNRISVVTDQYGTPTLANDLADAILKLLESKKNGIYHVVGRDLINRFDFTKKIAKVFQLDSSLVLPITSDQFDQKASRGKKLGLRTDKIQKELKIKLSGVDEGLRRMRSEMINNG